MHAHKRPIIYIVDDDEAVRDSLRALLEFDFDVRDFSSAMEFLAKRDGTRGACLLLDLHMPLMDGIDLLEHMKAEGSNLPAIVITGRSDPILRQRALKSGAFELLDKPVAGEMLLNAIGRAVDSHTITAA